MQQDRPGQPPREIPPPDRVHRRDPAAWFPSHPPPRDRRLFGSSRALYTVEVSLGRPLARPPLLDLVSLRPATNRQQRGTFLTQLPFHVMGRREAGSSRRGVSRILESRPTCCIH